MELKVYGIAIKVVTLQAESRKGINYNVHVKKEKEDEVAQDE